MNALNRIAMLLIALLLLAVPMLLLLVAFGAIPPELADRYTGYQGVVDAVGGLSSSYLTATGVRFAVGAAGALVALIALLLLLRELTFGRRPARGAVIDATPGKETRITAGAVKALVEGAAGDAGVASTSASLATAKGSYDVSCAVRVPRGADVAQVATETREEVVNKLKSQDVPVRNVQVTVRGIES